MLSKFQNNFGVRGIINCEKEGLLEVYLQNLYQYTIGCFQTGKKRVITELMAFINQIWQRLTFETMQIKAESQQKVEMYIQEIIQVQMDESLKAANQEDLADDDSDGEEDFHKSQRTQKLDDFDQLSKLMKQKLEYSVSLLLDRHTRVIQLYEQCL